MEKITKTNAMRALDANKIPYQTSSYEYDESDLSGVHASKMLGIEPEIMFKTLVTVTDKLEHRVFLIPVAEELDLKKCAVVSGDKRVELIHVKELLPLTGYIRGGCTAVGMKKQYITRIDTSAESLTKMIVSGGKIGVQLMVAPQDWCRAARAEFADVVK